MQKNKMIGKYNINIHGGSLDHKTHRWFYVLQLDKFDENSNPIGSNYFYIQGHENGNDKEKFVYSQLIQFWLDEVTEKELDQIFNYKENHRFRINKPCLMSISNWR